MDVQKLERRVTSAVATLVLVGLLCVASVFVDIHRLSVIGQIADARAAVADHQITTILQLETRLQPIQSAARSSDHTTRFVAILSLAAILFCGAFFIRWFRQAYRNVVAFGFRPRFSVGWAAGGWFVPLVSWFYPKQIANDIWRGSDPDRQPPGFAPTPLPGLLNAWWAAWVIANLFGGASRIFAKPDTASIGSLRTATWLDMLFDILNVVAAGLAVLVVADITGRQRRRVARMPEPWTQPSAPGSLAPTGVVEPAFPAQTEPAWPPPAEPVWPPPPAEPATPPRAEPPDTSGSVAPPGFPGG